MSDEANPYQSPEMEAVPVSHPVIQGGITETMMLYLKEASPWLRFIGILGFVTAGLTALSGLFFIAFVPLMNTLALSGMLWTVAGGVAYTAGAVFYAFGRKVKYIHSVWHLFVILGSVLQFIAILFYVIT
jgi:channel protein (hemolysin III family)